MRADLAVQNSEKGKEAAAPLLLKSLQNPAVYDHPVSRFDVVETHISWVVLTGPFAYKIKKPVNLGFLDFSTLAKRKFYCEEELRTNKRLCPDLYLKVLPISGNPGGPVLGGSGEPFEYAIKMKQFDEDLLWDRMSKRGDLTAELLDRLVPLVARFHQQAPPAPPDRGFGLPGTFWKSVESTLGHLDRLINNAKDRILYDHVMDWMKAEFASLAERMIQRKIDGYVRELHGDLHLRNIALFSRDNPEILVFDGIEFDENLRWIDVINDAAFLTMDLEHRRRPDLAWRFLNAYLEFTGDYPGLDLWRMYSANRALVRAKVLAIQKSEEGNRDFPTEARDFLNLAAGYGKPRDPRLYITHGLSGSGKTTVTKELIELLGAVRLRSDIERRRLFGLAPGASSGPQLKESMYGSVGNKRTYNHLKELSVRLLQSKLTVIVDAAFLRRDDRRGFRDVAELTGAEFKILDFHVDEHTLHQRIQRRMRQKNDASEADLQVLAGQMRNREDLSSDEKARAIRVDPERLRQQFTE